MGFPIIVNSRKAKYEIQSEKLIKNSQRTLLFDKPIKWTPKEHLIK